MTTPPYNNGYFQIVADPGGAALTLCATTAGGLVCQPGQQTGRLSKWLFTQADGGYWYVRTAAPITLPSGRRVTNLDGSAGVTIDTFVSGAPGQMWSFAADGSVLRIRCRHDTNNRLAATGAGAPPVLGPDQVPEVALAGWRLVETSP